MDRVVTATMIAVSKQIAAESPSATSGDSMSTPSFVVKKINGQYVTVPMNSCMGTAAAWFVGGSLLLANGVTRGGFRGAVSAGFGTWMIARGILGYNPLEGC